MFFDGFFEDEAVVEWVCFWEVRGDGRGVGLHMFLGLLLAVFKRVVVVRFLLIFCDCV